MSRHCRNALTHTRRSGVGWRKKENWENKSIVALLFCFLLILRLVCSYLVVWFRERKNKSLSFGIEDANCKCYWLRIVIRYESWCSFVVCEWERREAWSIGESRVWFDPVVPNRCQTGSLSLLSVLLLLSAPPTRLSSFFSLPPSPRSLCVL